MKDTDLIIFDCDGVLVDSEVLSCRCLVDVLGQHGVTIDLEQVFRRFLGRSSSAVADYYVAATGQELPSRFRSDYFDRLRAEFETSLKLTPDVRSVLDGINLPYCL